MTRPSEKHRQEQFNHVMETLPAWLMAQPGDPGIKAAALSALVTVIIIQCYADCIEHADQWVDRVAQQMKKQIRQTFLVQKQVQ